MGKPEKILSYSHILRLFFVGLLLLSICGVAVAAPATLRVRQTYLDFPSLTIFVDLLDLSEKKADPGEGGQFSVTVGDKAFKVDEKRSFAVEKEGLTTVFLVDVSSSIKEKRFKELRQAISSWIERMGPYDRAAIIAFGEKVTLAQDFTSEKKALLYSLQFPEAKDPHTQLNLGVIRALELAKRKQEDLPQRRMILLCSDGIDDMPGGATIEEVRDVLALDPVPIYSIFFDADNMSKTERDSAIKSIGEFSRRSGGQLYDAKSDPFSDIFKNISASLNNSIVLKIEMDGLIPDGTTKRVEVSFTDESVSLFNGIDIRLSGITPVETIPVEETSGDIVAGEEVSDEETVPQGAFPKWAYFAAGVAVLLALLAIAFMVMKKKRQKDAASKHAEHSPTVPMPSNGGTIQVPKVSPTVSRPSGPSINIELIVTGTKGAVGTFKASFSDRLVLGRNKGESALSIPDDGTISSRHCELVFSKGKLFVQDLQSTNGTMVNGVPIKGSYPLNEGDKLTLGKTELRLRILGVK